MIDVSKQGRVLELILNRPEKRNALNHAMCVQLVAAIESADSDPEIGAILLSGNGTVFCSGMDLKEAGITDLTEIHERLFTVIERIHKPMIAAVHGVVVGGGLGVAANTHIVIAAPETRFSLPEIRIALWPVMIFPAVALAIGERRTTELSITGRYFSAQEAHSFGLVSEIADQPLERARELADEVSRHSPGVFAKGLEYSRTIRGMSSAEAAAAGKITRDQLMADPAFAAAIAAFFRKDAGTTKRPEPQT